MPVKEDSGHKKRTFLSSFHFEFYLTTVWSWKWPKQKYSTRLARRAFQLYSRHFEWPHIHIYRKISMLFMEFRLFFFFTSTLLSKFQHYSQIGNLLFLKLGFSKQKRQRRGLRAANTNPHSWELCQSRFQEACGVCGDHGGSLQAQTCTSSFWHRMGNRRDLGGL